MAARPRFYVLCLLSLAAITFPFLWLKLAFDYKAGAVSVTWAFDNGLLFFQNLSPAVLAAVCFGVGIWLWPHCKPVVHSLPLDRVRPTTLKKALVAVLIVGVLVGGFFFDDKYLGLGILMGIYMLQALGLNITVGFTGILVIGYAAFYSFGAYVFAVLQQPHYFPGLQWWAALPVVFVCGATLGWLLGLPCLRLRGDYLAIVTLGFAESYREVLRNLELTGGDKGISVAPVSQIQAAPGLTAQQTKYFLVFFVLLMVIFLIRRLYRSPIGRAWVAIREDEIAANSMGIPVVRMKLLAFSLSAAVAAVAGLLYVAHVGFIDPASSAFEQSIMVLAMVILGGIGSIPGVLLGSALLYLLPEYLRDSDFLLRIAPNFSDYRLFIFGGIMVAMMLLRPQGLLGSSRHKQEIQGNGK
jgi:branched-chain amino acid transport system permease protein